MGGGGADGEWRVDGEAMNEDREGWGGGKDREGWGGERGFGGGTEPPLRIMPSTTPTVMKADVNTLAIMNVRLCLRWLILAAAVIVARLCAASVQPCEVPAKLLANG